MSVVLSWNSPVLVFSVPALQRSRLPSVGGIQAYTIEHEGSEALYEAQTEVVLEYA